MLERIISVIAPYSCLCCKTEGSHLCDACGYNLLEEQISCCHYCNMAINNGLWCDACRAKTWCDEAWALGEYKGVLKTLIAAYKFSEERAAASTLAGLFHQSLPRLPASTVIVPVPTIAPHVRRRGFDHTQDLAKKFAKLRNMQTDPVILRANNNVQLGATRAQREKQAKTAFKIVGPAKSESYLIIDDVITSGSTVKEIARLLKNNGVKTVYAALVAREPLQHFKTDKNVLQ